MKHTLLGLLLVAPFLMQAQQYRLAKYGDFEHWCVRDITESKVIGGNTKRIYAIGPTDTLVGNIPYRANTPWSNSNAYAKVMGVTKTSCSVTPASSHDGSTCAKLETRYEELRVAGLVDIRILVSGCLFWGQQQEPLNSVNSPYSLMTWGVPFTTRPAALVLDYKAFMPNRGTITTCKVVGHSQRPGDDAAEVLFILQKRWEDSQGNIHALRVGTAVHHIEHSTPQWEIAHRIPVLYGDARKDPRYKDFMKLGPKGLTYYAKNSRGKIVPIHEDGWAPADTKPTHAMMMITTSLQEAFSGTVGNTLWVDNIKFEY